MVDPIDLTQALAARRAVQNGAPPRDTEALALRRAAESPALADVVEARALWADPFETVQDWVAAGIRIARAAECRAWAIADWAYLGPARLGNRAFQYLGDGDRDPEEDAFAVFPLTGKTLKNYGAVSKRFPPSVALAFPDIAARFTIFQDLTPRDLPDGFVLGVLAEAQGSFDRRREWDSAPDRIGTRPPVWTRRDVRDAVAEYRRQVAPAGPAPAPDPGPPPPAWVPAEDAAPPTDANPFGAPIQVQAGTPIRVDERFGRSLSFVGAGPLVVRSVAPANDADPWAVVVEVDADFVRTSVQNAVVAALSREPAATGPTFVDFLADQVVAALTEGGTL